MNIIGILYIYTLFTPSQFTIELKNNDTIADIRNRIYDVLEYNQWPPIKIIYNNHLLTDELYAEDIGLTNNCKLHISYDL